MHISKNLLHACAGSEMNKPPMLRSVLMLLGTYSPAAHRGIARYGAEHGWHLQMDMARIPVIPRGWTGDGIIAGLGEWEAPLNFVRSAAVRGIPVVDIYIIHPEVALPRVVGDNPAIGRLAAEHFIERGWKHFCWFSRVNHHVAQLRLSGFASVIREHGLSVRPLLKQSCSSHQQWVMMHAKLIKALLAAPKPLAVFAFNDFDAALVIDACRAAGCRVPEDVAVLGVDNNELVVNSHHVPLSSVRLDLERIGYEGCALLDALMGGEPAPPEFVRLIPPQGIAVRVSTDTFAVNHPTVREALRFIQDHLQRSLGVDEIAAAVGVSRRTLEETFRKELRQGVHEMLMHLRTRHARDLLLTTQRAIQDIAAQTGFCHASHLNRVFKKCYGLSPRKYRK